MQGVLCRRLSPHAAARTTRHARQAVSQKARAAGARTVLDVVVPGPGDHWHKFEEILTETDVFLPKFGRGGTDNRSLGPGWRRPSDSAPPAQRPSSITQGDHGTLLVEDGRKIHAGVYPTNFVGGTGAGDAFDAGFIAGMLAGEDSAGCLRWGSALGASCVRSVSATQSVFNRQEALAFMREHELWLESL